MNYKSGICTFCGTGCGHLLRIDENKVRGIFPIQNHPVSKGRLCVRGWNLHELLNTGERIQAPLIRRGDILVEAGYDEAVLYLVEKLSRVAKDNPHAIGFLASPRSSNEENYLLMKMARAIFKTNNISLDSDPGHRNSLEVLHMGTGMAGMLGSLEEICKADLIMVVGIDITKQNPIIGSEIHKAARAGARVVTVDTRKTQMAKLSSDFFQVMPGSLRIFTAAMAKCVIEEGLADSDFIKKYTRGSEVFARTLESLDNYEVTDKTGIEMESIREMARCLAGSSSAMIFFSSGISGQDKETIAYIYNLFLITGKIGREGCGVNPITGINNLQGSYDMGVAPDLLTGFQQLSDDTAREKFNKAWGATLDGTPGKSVYEMLKGEPALKALVAVEHDEGIIRNADKISMLDFVAYIGTYENDFIQYADVVLPVASYVEFDGTFTNTERRIQLSQKKIDPNPNILPGWKLYAMIAEKSGARWNYNSTSEIMDEIAKLTPSYSGITHDKLRGTFGIKWPCNDSRPQGTERFSLDDIEHEILFAGTEARFAVPVVSEEYPILLLIGEAQHYWHQNNLMKKTFIPLREYNATLLLYPEGYVAISPEYAKQINVRDRWPVMIVSPYGSMEAMVMITDKVKPNTAYVAYFVHDMISKFFLEHKDVLKRGEDATIPVRIVKV